MAGKAPRSQTLVNARFNNILTFSSDGITRIGMLKEEEKGRLEIYILIFVVV